MDIYIIYLYYQQWLNEWTKRNCRKQQWYNFFLIL